jgi:hypothetical protein
MLPGPRLALPDAGLFESEGCRGFVGDQALIQPHIGDHANIAHDSNPGGAKGRIEAALHSSKIKVEAMKLHAFNQLTHRLRLEGRQRWIAKLLVSWPIGRGNGCQKSFGQLQEFSFGTPGYTQLAS